MTWKCFLIFITLNLVANNQYASHIIDGKIIDSEQTPIEFANVVLYKMPDSVMAAHTTTNEDGEFSFTNIRKGDYYISVSYIGFIAYTSNKLHLSKNHTLDIIELKEDTQMLEGVTVTAQKRFIEQHIDKLVVNPEASITTASDNIFDVLIKSPGIIVDKDGNISLKGKSGVSVMIDNKPTRLSGEQLAAILRNMQSTSVERIEIIENPHARYDAEGSSGIINIKTKQGAIRGFNGTLTAGTQINDRFRNNMGLDLNYRDEKWTFSGNFYGGIYNWTETFDLTRRFTDGTIFYEKGKATPKSYFGAAKINANYRIHKKHTIGFMSRYNSWHWGKGTPLINTDIKKDNILIQNEKSTSRPREGGPNFNVNFNYHWEIDSTSNLSADLDFINHDYNNKLGMHTEYNPHQSPYNIYLEQNAKTKIYSFKVDYENSLTEKTKVDAGMKVSKIEVNSNSLFQESDGIDNKLKAQDMVNDYKYEENVDAVYLSFRHHFSSDFDIQAGLRTEQTRIKSYNSTIDSLNKCDYLNLFPSLFINKKWSDNHQSTASYTYRVGRPNFWNFNPIIWIKDPYTYEQGNPFLQPEFTHSVKFSHSFKQTYILSAGYSRTNQYYSRLYKQDDQTKKTLITWENLDKRDNFDLTLILPVHITSWWKINTNATLFYTRYQSILFDQKLDNSRTCFHGNMNQTFILPKGWTIELSGVYESKTVYGMGVYNAKGGVDVGAQKLLFNKKLTLKASVTDIFNTDFYSYTFKFDNVNTSGIEKFDTRRFRINLTWRFGNEKFKPIRQHASGAAEEESRTNK